MTLHFEVVRRNLKDDMTVVSLFNRTCAPLLSLKMKATSSLHSSTDVSVSDDNEERFKDRDLVQYIQLPEDITNDRFSWVPGEPLAKPNLFANGSICSLLAVRRLWNFHFAYTSKMEPVFYHHHRQHDISVQHRCFAAVKP
ncbi:hypothetical protein CSKR_106019 [Clonorchis sinensis]|uniref:Uncharacterized protein n=1 Tax=Clonorchis sinensis TaxID=79923 RepID=A0A3R7F5U6_CLOSI|nr:hypothetical protein CSKR_106019 [Clonorchis sinensis]